MGEYFIEAKIGGTSIVKVTADNQDDAIDAARQMIANDFNDAGPLRATDVLARALGSPEDFDQSIMVTRGATDALPWPDYKTAPDDPDYDPEEDDD
jgi:hypothetical protein